MKGGENPPRVFFRHNSLFGDAGIESTILGMTNRTRLYAAVLAAMLFFPFFLWADGSSFDLDGPGLRLRVTRGKQTLGIGEVPNLLGGDKLWIQPTFPDGQVARYLLIVSFLRGSTNPPPEEWFTKVGTGPVTHRQRRSSCAMAELWTSKGLVTLRLGDPNDLPINDTLTFFVKEEEKVQALHEAGSGNGG